MNDLWHKIREWLTKNGTVRFTEHLGGGHRMAKTEPTLDELEDYVRATAAQLKGKDFMIGSDPRRPFTVVMREIPPRRPSRHGCSGYYGHGAYGTGVYSPSAFLDFGNRELVVSPAKVRECYKNGSLYTFVEIMSCDFFGYE